MFSRADARWIPIDPIRCLINKRKVFDPTPNPNAAVKPDRRRPVRVENRMVYVVAFEEDGFARDVTPRYAREYGAKVAKVQQGGRGRKEWWERIMAMVKRPYQLVRTYWSQSLTATTDVSHSRYSTGTISRMKSCRRISSRRVCLQRWPALRTILCAYGYCITDESTHGGTPQICTGAASEERRNCSPLGRIGQVPRRARVFAFIRAAVKGC